LNDQLPCIENHNALNRQNQPEEMLLTCEIATLKENIISSVDFPTKGKETYNK
jgi:hypothetical protein